MRLGLLRIKDYNTVPDIVRRHVSEAKPSTTLQHTGGCQRQFFFYYGNVNRGGWK